MKSLRNPLLLAVSLLVLLVANAFGERQRAPEPQPQTPTISRKDTEFKGVPGSKLKIRAVEYDGAVNGKLTVQVKNTEKSSIKFAAQGLYFVPEGDPDTAPQRLGAVGPMTIASDKEGVGRNEIEIPAGKTVELQLDVFCIDSHRSSPSSMNTFNVGATKMPKELSTTIDNRAKAAAKKYDSEPAPYAAAKSEIQSEVWRSRDSKWVDLDGDGKQEAAKKKK